MSGSDTGIDFNFSFAPGTTEQQILGFELAGEIWSQYLVDTYKGENLEVNVHVEMGDDVLPANIIGASFPTIEKTTFGQVRDALIDDATTEVDEQAIDYLKDYLGSRYSVDILVGEEVVNGNFDMHTTSANLKALGLKPGDSQDLDGYIVMNSLESSEISWDYTYLDAPAADELSFLSTAIHELGHTIGFISGIDYSGETESNFINELINYSDLTREIAAEYGVDTNTASITQTSVMDLFRVSLASQDQGTISLTEGDEASFSLDGIVSSLEFSTGLDNQASHWTEGNLGVMNPTLGLGEEWSISINDLSVMDVIGWDVDYSVDFELEDLYDTVQSQVNQKLIEGEYLIDERFADIDSILDTEAYNWSRRSRSSSSSKGGFWWSSRSSRSSSSSGGFWQVGYWASYETQLGTSAMEADSFDNRNEWIDSEASTNKLASLSDRIWGDDDAETGSGKGKDKKKKKDKGKGKDYFSWKEDFWGTKPWKNKDWKDEKFITKKMKKLQKEFDL